MDFSIIFGNLDIYLEGLKNILISGPVRVFIYFFRGTPLLVQMFLIYYGLGQFEPLKTSFLWIFFKEAYFCALFVIRDLIPPQNQEMLFPNSI